MSTARNTLVGLRMLAQPQHRKTVLNILRVYPDPLGFFRRYVSKSGEYPCRFPVKVAGKTIGLELYGPHDLDTLNQIFCREDYPVDPRSKLIVDIGANIGLSARFFLETCPLATVVSFEPSIVNEGRFWKNLPKDDKRIRFFRKAVSNFDGKAMFKTEPTGRYGALADDDTGGTYEVEVVSIGKVLDGLLSEHVSIDLLKIDVEGSEERIMRAISHEQLLRISAIHAEYQGSYVPPGFVAKRYGYVTHFKRKVY